MLKELLSQIVTLRGVIRIILDVPMAMVMKNNAYVFWRNMVILELTILYLPEKI